MALPITKKQMTFTWLLLSLFMLTTGATYAQKLYKCNNGSVRFYSDAVLEDIEAVNKSATAALNAESKEVAVLIPIKSFVFDNALMQEHFNENYMESSQYPSANFKGKLVQSLPKTPGVEQETEVTGDLTIHGVTRTTTLPVVLSYGKDGRIHVTSRFMVKLEDHNIKIPQVVFQNIAETVEVTLDFYLSAL